VLPFIEELGPWAWLILGLLLVGLEMLVPGVFLIWLGIAAMLTGIADWFFALSWQGSSLVFALLSVIAVVVGRAVSRSDRAVADRSALNRRGEALVGQTFRLDAPIVGGEGRLRIGDSFWRVVGPDSPAGATIRVTRVDGATLVAEPA
jgi:membrane protein implicated in regulation of membrane protease activity